MTKITTQKVDDIAGHELATSRFVTPATRDIELLSTKRELDVHHQARPLTNSISPRAIPKKTR